MKPSISEEVAKFKKTSNFLSLFKALFLILKQNRFLELAYGIYCYVFFKPSTIALHSNSKNLQSMLLQNQCFISGPWLFSREQLIDNFGKKYAVHHLPNNFCKARSETIVCDQDTLIIGEYGSSNNAKRLFCLTKQSCIVTNYYKNDKSVRHIHAVYKHNSSSDVLVTTGDTRKVLDLWSLKNGELVFNKRLKKNLAGHTAITKVNHEYYMGTDFSNRPNYIERLSDEKKFFFPKPAYLMDSKAFQVHQDRYILAINTTRVSFGKQWSVSIFDTATEEFVYCDFTQNIANMVNNS